MPLLIALQFLTTIPIHTAGAITPQTMGRAMAWFPVVGLIIGALLAASDRFLSLVFPPAVTAGLLILLWVALTGGLHLDGLMDCCDGLLGAKPPNRRLEIMRDTHLGAFAVLGAVSILLIKYAAVQELSPVSRTAALIVTPALSRAMMVFAARAYPYARSEPGLGQLFREGLSWRHVGMAGLVGLSAATLALGSAGIGLTAILWVETAVISWLVQRRIPGLTGDAYGLINELTEVGALLVLLLI
jgi:adenosylcobinamide-GDP ribazoletransferase